MTISNKAGASLSEIQHNGTTFLKADGTDTTVTDNLVVDGNLTVTGTTAEIGVGQTWQSVTRTVGVTYTNNTGKPIMLCAYGSGGSGSSTLTVDGIAVQSLVYNNSGGSIAVIIPDGVDYIFSGTSMNVRELR